MDSQATFLQRIAAGDPSAIEGCLTKYRGMVWSIVRRFAGNHADAEDAVQEVFIELWRHAGRFDPARASESTFIGTIARRRLIDRKRRQARRPEAASLGAEPAAASQSQADRLEVIEEGRRAREMLEQLRPEQRRVLELSFDRGMSQQEIAAATSLPLGTVKTHARRGLMRLRELLENAADGPVEAARPVIPNQGNQP
jgi:RNA polymerase sigma-70 factor (ECF subfamily)